MAGGAEKLSLAAIRAKKPHTIKTTASGKGPRWAKYGDGKGLWLMVGPSGQKRWQFTYTVNKVTKHLSLGPVELGDGLERNVSEARAKAREYRHLLKLGIDPRTKLEAEREAEREAILSTLRRPVESSVPTFRALTERYIEPRKSEWSERTLASWEGTMRDYVYPVIGEKLVDSVTLDDALEVLRPIWKRIPDVAARVRNRIGKILAYASSLGHRPDDNLTRPRGPLDFELGDQKRRPKNHDAMDYTALPGFMKELRANTEGFAPRALEFLILTAARTGEALGATWDEIDLEKRTWSIPAARMKMERDHLVPLSEDAVKLLKALPHALDNKHVFPSPQKEKAALSNMAMTNVLKRMKRKDGVTVHGFRSTFRTWAAEQCLDVPKDIAEAALAHIVGGVEGAYQRGTFFDARRGLMDRWAAFAGSAE